MMCDIARKHASRIYESTERTPEKAPPTCGAVRRPGKQRPAPGAAEPNWGCGNGAVLGERSESESRTRIRQVRVADLDAPNPSRGLGFAKSESRTWMRRIRVADSNSPAPVRVRAV